MRRSEPLFRLDPGWLYTLAGLAIIVASVLLPAERDLHELRQQLSAIEAREAWNARRLQAYDAFLKELASKAPALLKRLAASQLNLMPEGEQPLLMATSIEHTVSDWIEATVPEPEFEPAPAPDTLLSRLADGPRRLWLMAGGAMMVFVGLISGIGLSPRPSLPVPAEVTVEASERDPGLDAGEAIGCAAGPCTSGSGEFAGHPTGDEVAPAAASTASIAEPLDAELADESHELDPERFTASAVEVENWEWSEPRAPFEAPEADSIDTPDAGAAEGAAPASDAVEPDEHGWMREHGSD